MGTLSRIDLTRGMWVAGGCVKESKDFEHLNRFCFALLFLLFGLGLKKLNKKRNRVRKLCNRSRTFAGTQPPGVRITKNCRQVE